MPLVRRSPRSAPLPTIHPSDSVHVLSMPFTDETEGPRGPLPPYRVARNARLLALRGLAVPIQFPVTVELGRAVVLGCLLTSSARRRAIVNASIDRAGTEPPEPCTP